MLMRMLRPNNSIGRKLRTIAERLRGTSIINRQISRNEIIKKNNIRNFGSGDVYFIPNYQLNKLI